MSDVPNGHASTEEPTLLTGANGTGPMDARESIAAQLEAEVARCRERKDALDAELQTVNDELKAFEQALYRLRGQPLIKHDSRGPYKPRKSPVRVTPSGISPERLDVIRQSIFRLSRKNDEFRQVDVRAESGDASSGRMAQAFEQFRQEGLIRFARKDGISKCFRLTAEGIRARDEAADVIQ